MSTTAAVQTAAKTPTNPPSGLFIQRQCACGGSAELSGECESCKSRKFLGRPIQHQLAIGNPGDAYEVEADRVAEQVLDMGHPASVTTARDSTPASLVRLRVNGLGGAAARVVPPIVEDVLASQGHPLDRATRAFFEPRFGHDFGQIRVHRDDRAARSAASVNALAYTSGQDIVFAQGRYAPHDSAGRQLLAHELAHVIQQGGSRTAFGIQRQCVTGRTCTEPISGDPGPFNASEYAAEASGRTARSEEARRDPAAVVASGHGSRAQHVEAFAAAEGIDLSAFYGVLVDRDLGASTGAAAGPCASLTGVVPPFAGPRDAMCMFVPAETDRLIDEATDLPPPRMVGGYPREYWVQWLRELLVHEAQHIRYDSTAHPDIGGSCTRSTTLYRASDGTEYPLDFYLSELSAILAEFEPVFTSVRRRTRVGDYGALLDNLQSAYRDALFSPYESINGILTALRCHCDCADADAFIRDTFEFTSAGWSDTTRGIFLDFIRSRMPILQWPDSGS
ncbi:DUF4157 domain-containing protein [Nitrospira defluvii]|uniref:eCIS core domain-containing protein n=1 Tax=Nitrospira defluvii TaxID=330214 RepID=A0ABM8S6Y9_9BACT|nr:DUF4157 domain-containing protein [Nitrospira defluvii]CAE6792130.1 conserved hypothetical protein [Nitrospira defluvii]